MRAARAAVVETAPPGQPLRAALVGLYDDWLASLMPDATDVALVALGSYGRQDLAPGSDLDLLLLHRGRGDVATIADRIWYPVWDAGLSLDHSVRTVDDARAVAAVDLRAALGCLDARHVAGDASLTEAMVQVVRQDWRRSANRRLAELGDVLRERGERHGEAAFRLEPDIKECRGGLRDVQAIRAAALAWVADAPTARVESAYAVLLDVRGELHRSTGRGSDRLVREEQAPVASALGYPDDDALLHAVSGAARTIAFATDATWRRVERAGRQRSWRRRQPVRRPLADGVVEQDGEIVLARGAEPGADPVLVLRVAATAAQAGLHLAPHTIERLAAEAAPLPQPWPPGARDAFVSLLGAGRPTAFVVESLDDAGLLARLIPEWAAVRCRPQHNPAHTFTVDRHLIETVVEAARSVRRVARPDLLLLGALLHDIGKGYSGDHSEVGATIAAGVAARLGWAQRDVRTITTLVRHHLLLPDTATRRDLQDPATIAKVVAAVGDHGTLDLLQALTEADAAATGPTAWSDWKAALVGELVLRVGHALAGDPYPQPPPLTDEQLALLRARDLAVAVNGSSVTFAAPDRPGLLWRAAGVLALHRLDVRAANVATVGATAVTTFEVSPRYGALPDEVLLRSELLRALDGDSSLEPRLRERERAYAAQHSRAPTPQVLVDDDASHTATVVEVRTHDSPGLLHRLARALDGCGLDVRSARVSTLGAEVVDAFYVTDRDGKPVTGATARAELVAALLGAARVGSTG